MSTNGMATIDGIMNGGGTCSNLHIYQAGKYDITMRVVPCLNVFKRMDQ